MGRPAKDKRDIYYRKAKEEGWRARSAFKLIHLSEMFAFFGNGCSSSKFVDLCCAPGSWSQALSRATSRATSRIVSVDLQDIAPIAGVDSFVGDITTESTAVEIVKRLGGEKADVVVCDGAPDVTGIHDLDEFLQSQLVVAAATIAASVLQPGGVFVSKTFRGSSTDILLARLRVLFVSCCIAKPRSSRSSSAEGFFVCRKLVSQSARGASLTPRPLPSVSVVAAAAAAGGITEARHRGVSHASLGVSDAVVDFLSIGSLSSSATAITTTSTPDDAAEAAVGGSGDVVSFCIPPMPSLGASGASGSSFGTALDEQLMQFVFVFDV